MKLCTSVHSYLVHTEFAVHGLIIVWYASQYIVCRRWYFSWTLRTIPAQSIFVSIA
jgi:hypothetical protein